MRFPIVGGSYQSRSFTADNERTVNLYPEVVESGTGKNRAVLYGCPGLQLYQTLPTGPCRGLAFYDSRIFAAGGSKLYYFDPYSGAAPSLVGDIGGAWNSPVRIVSSGIENLISAGGSAYLINAGGVFSAVAGMPVVPSSITFLDGYFITCAGNDRKFYTSELYNGASWPALNYAVKESASDNVIATVGAPPYLWLFGTRTIEAWFNAGNADFPFQRVSGGVIQQGCVAADSIILIDNGMMWLGQDTRGGVVCWKANGFQPTRVSNHAVEYAWSKYTSVADAFAYAYVEDGHTFYVVHFPTGDATWVYDVNTGLWHERASWSGGAYHRHWGQFHLYAVGDALNQGHHFLADYRNGNIYKASVDYYDDAGTPRRWLRVTPPLSDEMKWRRHKELWVDMQPDVDLTAYMKFSDDGGKNWSHEFSDTLSAADTRQRIRWARLGRSRNRVYQIYGSSAVKTAITDGYVEVGS